MSKRNNAVLGFLKALALPAALYALLLLWIPERLGNWSSFLIILSMSVISTITAYGISFGWVSGIMDFSIGSVVILSGIVGALCGNRLGVLGLFGGSILTAVLLSTVVGGAFRLLRIPSLVVSLGMLMIFEVTGDRITNWTAALLPGESTGFYIRLDQSLTFLGTTPWNFLILIAVMGIYSLVYFRTRFASQTRVVGSDELIARNVGIQPMSVKFKTYLVGGVFFGISAALTAAYSGSATAQINMTTMAAVFRPLMGVIIALSIQKLVPVSVGIFIGTFSLNIIFTGIIALGWSDDLQNVILGVFLIIIVSLPKVMVDMKRFKQRRGARKAHALKEG